MYDIIIVGAGPAGTTAALYAEKMGLKSILVDKSVFPRDKICGDALSGKSIRMIRELNLLSEVSKLEGAQINRITFGSPSNKQFDLYLNKVNKDKIEKKGFVIPRKIFDNFLFEKAKDVTETRQGFKVTDIIKNNNVISGVIGINKNGEEESLYAPLILGCDGPYSIIARKLNLYKMDMKHTSVAIRCYYSGIKGLTDQIELHFLKEVKPGYLWLFPAGKDIANIGIGLSKVDAKKEERTLSQLLDIVTESKYFKQRFEGAVQLEKPVGWNLPVGTKHRINHGDGFMLLGDAAGLVDPFTGEGIGNAMVSAKYAIQLAKKSKKNHDYSEKILSEYDSLLWSELGKELRTSTKLQKLAKYSFLLNFVINRASRNEDVKNIISGMLANEIPKDELSNPSFYFKMFFS
jgi:menaquinone-9 beta-reductase